MLSKKTHAGQQLGEENKFYSETAASGEKDLSIEQHSVLITD